ncbi:MAG: hypothetical protein P8077_06055 [Gammaproteobacteria bacterium]
MNAFAASKLQELQDFCTRNPTDPACTGGTPVSESSLFVLMSLGLFGLGVTRRRRLFS